MKIAVASLLVVGCGRWGFGEQADARVAKDTRGIIDAAYYDAPGTKAIDAPLPPDVGPAACANFDLGSALGDVVSGTTIGASNHYQRCNSTDSPDVSYAWTAPASAKYLMSLCNGPDQNFDSVLTVLDGTCSGAQLACDDDGCGGAGHLSQVTVTLNAGQQVIIVVDGYLSDSGKFLLSITEE